MAQVMLSTLANRRGVRAQISSAGLLPGGAPLPRETKEALVGLGFDDPELPRFRSLQVTDELVAGADLVVGMAREHVRELVVRLPGGWGRSFTLKELVRRGGIAGSRRQHEDLGAWLARLGVGRNRSELLGESDADDVADPAGSPLVAFERTALEIQGLCVALSDLLWS